MTRSGRRVAQLAAIRDLRALAEQVAEARAVHSARASHEQETRCRQEADLLEAALDDWQIALTEERFDPVRTAIFGQAVERQDMARMQGLAELATRAAQRDEERQECNRAQAGRRCAADLLKHAERRHLRLREERILAARDDANAGRGPVS